MSFLNPDLFPVSGEIIVAVIDPPDIVSRAVNKFNFKIIGRRFGFNIKSKFIIIRQINRKKLLYPSVAGSFCEIIIETYCIACKSFFI